MKAGGLYSYAKKAPVRCKTFQLAVLRRHVSTQVFLAVFLSGAGARAGWEPIFWVALSPKRIVNYIPDALLCRGADFHHTHFGYNISRKVTKAAHLHDVYQFSICCSSSRSRSLFFCSTEDRIMLAWRQRAFAWLAWHTLRQSNNLQWYCHPALGCQNMHCTN